MPRIGDENMTQKMLSVKEAAQRLGVGLKTVYRYLEDGHLPYLRVGGPGGARYMIPESALQTLDWPHIGRP